ncbi:DUF3987 domain-containing protein [Prevotella sp. RM4]|uniref:DUF3987 domain-containing protein n=1 Tax=Prevotella sp. RM4 TaxID=1200547 RepID=UPI00051C83C9|nr:DUF3987 domain-containing protein [Prevotella sp. RM4]
MSCHLVYYKDGAKMMRPVLSREEYLALRNGGEQRQLVQRIRNGEEALKHKLQQMNYSCLPNDDGSLKGSARMSTTVGMDIDHLSADEMPAIRERILSKKDELGLLMLEESARGGGYHLVFARKPELSQEENLKWASNLISVAYDSGAKDITRVFFTTSEEQLIYLDDAIFELEEVLGTDDTAFLKKDAAVACQNKFKGIAYKDIIAEFWRRTGGVPNTGERNKRLHQLAANLRSICDDSEEWLLALMPNLGLPDHEMRSIIHSACKEPTKGSRLMDQIVAALATSTYDTIDTDDQQLSIINSQLSIKKLPQGVKDSVAAVGPELAMPIITAVCPCIGALATGVKLDVHGRVRGLNLISYIVGEFASRKGDIDPVVDAWMSEVSAMDEMYQQQEDEYRRKKRASKNKKEQPEEIGLPVRYIALNNTVANLAERLANVEGKHAFSFTPEADTVAQKWRSAMSDFSVLLRQSYDGSRYDREAKSAEAVNVHIKHLLWNVVMCGTPDALYRVVTNYTDGFQSRIALSQTPDNTYAKLEDKPYVLTDRQTERIQQVAHLLPLMAGEVVLQKLEARGRAWLEKIRLEAMMNDDRVKARERFRTCVTAQRMVCCLMLCKVCEQLIQKHGLNGAETQLKQKPYLWKEMLQKTQTPAMLDMYDVIADQLLDSALYYFRDRIENAYRSRDYAAGNSRSRRSKNDTIYDRLDVQFSFDQAMQFSVAIKGADVTRNSVQQMLKNWRKQGLVSLTDDGGYRKVS